VENGNRSGGRGSGRPRRMSLKTTLFRRNDGSAAFEIGQFQKQNALDGANSATRSLSSVWWRLFRRSPLDSGGNGVMLI
ncbi:MAG TPA: hypothetical protein H9962_06355, partial [Candidatus Mailhella merdigallinarum]|nr:hypothetical protein [Candidatus Mailhella merdigallinarum]